MTECLTDAPADPVAVKPDTVWWVTPPVLSSAHPSCARFHSRLASSVAVPSGSDGSAPRCDPGVGLDELVAVVDDLPAAVAIEPDVDGRSLSGASWTWMRSVRSWPSVKIAPDTECDEPQTRSCLRGSLARARFTSSISCSSLEG